jgi:hypothetical protein
MKSRRIKIILWISVLVWTVGIWAAWTWAKAERNRAEIERAAWDGRRQELVTHLEALENQRSGLATRDAQERARADKEKADAEKAAYMKAMAYKLSQQRLDQNPQLQLLKLKATRAETLVKYSAFLREKKLTPEQIERLSAAWSDYEAAKLDIAAIRRDRSLSYDDPAVTAERKQAQAALMAVEKSVLGEARYEEFDLFKRMQPMRELVLGYVGKAALLGAPATEDQVRWLTEVLAAENTNFRNGGQVQFGGMDWDAGWARARAFLSAEQYELLVAETNLRRARSGVFNATLFIHEELAKEAAKTPGAR